MSPQPPDLFPERPVRSDFARAGLGRAQSRFLRAPSYRARRIITLSILAVVVFIVLRMAFSGTSLMTPGSVATIKAEGAWKQKPEQPGGLDIPNQNVQVYQSLDAKDENKPQTEHLMPPPETPQIPSLPAPIATTVTMPVPSSSNAVPQVESLTPPKLDIDSLPTPIVTPPVSAAVTPADASASTIAPAPSAAPVAAIQSTSSPTPPSTPPATAVTPATPAPHVMAAKTTKPKPMTMGQVLKDAQSAPKTDRIVQLASVQDEATAQDMADKMQTRYAAVLGSAQLRLVKADVEGKGTYYRIQSQPITDEHASGICAALKQMKAGCILVRP